MWKWMKKKNTLAHALIALMVLVFAGRASAGANANAMVSLDLIPAGGAGNQRDDGVTTGRVLGRGTTIAIEVFATGVTTPLVGMQIAFDFDASLLTFVKAENSAFSLSIPGRQGRSTNFASEPPVTLEASGFLARAEFTTLADVTGREFSIGIATLTLAENSESSDTFMPTGRVAFNATSTNFSLSLDADDAPGDQAVAAVEVHPDSVVGIQVFGTQIPDITGITLRFEYDATQVDYERFDKGGSVLPNAWGLLKRGSNPTFVEIAIGALGGRVTTNSGPFGAFRFRTTAAFSGTTIRLTRADLWDAGVITRTETLNVRVALLPPAAPSPDFNGDGEVGFTDFLLFAGRFGASRGDGTYESKYDLDADGEIGFSDFLTFSRSFGTSPGSGGGDRGQPDLIVESPSVGNRTLVPGQAFTLRATVRNAGTDSSAVTTARYYRSSDATISTGDTPVGSDRVERLAASGTRDISIRLTAPMRADTYYYGACVVRVSGERDADNNCSEGVRVIVQSGGGATPPPPDNARYWRDRSDSEYRIAWSPSPGATFYRVYFDSAIFFSVSCPGGCDLIATVTDSSASHNSGASRIGYWVRACNGAGCSNYVRAERVTASSGGSGGSADTYTPISGLRVENGRIQFASISVENCFSPNGIGGYEVHTSKWQRRSGTSWVDIPGTERTGEVCAYLTTTPGEYRLVGDVSINGVRGRHRSENTFPVN